MQLRRASKKGSFHPRGDWIGVWQPGWQMPPTGTGKGGLANAWQKKCQLELSGGKEKKKSWNKFIPKGSWGKVLVRQKPT